MAERLTPESIEQVARVIGVRLEGPVEATRDRLDSVLEEAALVLDHRSSAEELVKYFPEHALGAVSGFRLESPEVDPWSRVRVICDDEDVVVRLGKREDGSPFDRVFARIEDVTGGQLVAYGLASYRGDDSYAYVVMHEDSWDALRDLLGELFDEVFIGNFSE